MEQTVEKNAVKGRQIAEFDCHGARIVIVADEDAKPLEPGQVPEWVQVGTELRIRRMEEYKAETGHAPTRELIERFDRVMEERLNRFIENPRKYPWKPMGLREFELTLSAPLRGAPPPPSPSPTATPPPEGEAFGGVPPGGG